MNRFKLRRAATRGERRRFEGGVPQTRTVDVPRPAPDTRIIQLTAAGPSLVGSCAGVKRQVLANTRRPGDERCTRYRKSERQKRAGRSLAANTVTYKYKLESGMIMAMAHERLHNETSGEESEQWSGKTKQGACSSISKENRK